MPDQYDGPPALSMAQPGVVQPGSGGWNDPLTQGLLAMGSSYFKEGNPSGFATGFYGGQKANLDRAVEEQKLKQLQQQEELNKQLIPMMNNPQGFTPQMMDTMAMRLAAAGHGGAPTLAKLADARRAQEEGQKQLGLMKSSEGYGGLFGSLAESPHVGTEAKALQSQLDAGGGTPEQWMKHYERLRDTHYRATESASKRDEGPPVAVMTPQGPMYVSRKDAIGKTPATAASGPTVTNTDLHGEDYLKTLDPTTANIAKGVAEYRINPQTLSNRAGERKTILAHAQQVNPEYDQTQFMARSALRKDFTSGKAANNVTAINTAIGHIATLKGLYEALDNGNVPALNAIKNKLAQETGDPRMTETSIAVGAVSNELMRVFRQVGASETEVRDWEQKFKNSASPRQQLGAIKTATDLLESRIKAVNDQWDRGMGTKGGFPNMISPKSQAFIDSIKKPAGGNGGGWTPEKEQRYQDLLRKRGS